MALLSLFSLWGYFHSQACLGEPGDEARGLNMTKLPPVLESCQTGTTFASCYWYQRSWVVDRFMHVLKALDAK